MDSLFLSREIDKITDELKKCLDIVCSQKYGLENVFITKGTDLNKSKIKTLINHVKQDFPTNDNEKIIKKLNENRVDFLSVLKLIILLSSDLKTESKIEKYERKLLEKIAFELKIFRQYIIHHSEDQNDEELNQRFFQSCFLFFKLLKFPKYQIPRSIYVTTQLVANCKFWVEANAINNSRFNFHNFTFNKEKKDEVEFDEDLNELNTKKFIKSLSKPVKIKFGSDYKFREKPNKITFKPLLLLESISDFKTKHEVKETQKEENKITNEFSLLTVKSNN
jgi:hypothetical protein